MTAEELARLLDMPLPKLEKALQSLIEKGLVKASKEKENEK